MFYRAQGRKLGSCLFFFPFETDCVGISHLHVSIMRKGWGSWVCSASRRDDWCLNVYQCLRGRCQDYGAGLFLVVLRNRTRGNGQKLMHRKFHLNFFTLQVTQHLKQIAERSYGGSLKGDILVWTQHCAMCSGCLSRGRLDQVTHCCPFQP